MNLTEEEERILDTAFDYFYGDEYTAFDYFYGDEYFEIDISDIPIPDNLIAKYVEDRL